MESSTKSENNTGCSLKSTSIVNLFRFKDFTVLKVMLTAIIVGGIGVFAMMSAGLLEGWHIKTATLLGLVIGSSLFGVGMTVYGYCPGTGIAAVATGSLHALVGLFGMMVGGIAYALSYSWVTANILSVADFGKIRLPEVTPIPEWALWIILTVVALFLFRKLPHQTGQNQN